MTIARRALGQSGIDVSCIGLGTTKFGRNQEVKYPSGYSLPEDKEISALLDGAQNLGINLIDTAPAYGSSEQRLGRLMRNRDDWIICTKVGEEFLGGKSFYDFSGDYVRKSIERSLRDMQTDYLDIVLVHSNGKDTNIIDSTDCLPVLLELKEKGLIKAIGMSTKTVDGGLKAVEVFDVVMVTYNPSSTADEAVIDRAAELDKGVLIKKALNSGHVNETAMSVSECIRFALRPKGVSSVILGTINELHLRQNAAVL
jgi:aryl-alcohol dehydrogenase-like predicted oxidoreductase